MLKTIYEATDHGDSQISFLHYIVNAYWWKETPNEDRLVIASRRTFSAFCALAGAAGLSVSAINLNYFSYYPIPVLLGLLMSLACLSTPIVVARAKNFSRAVHIGIYVFLFLMAFLTVLNDSVISATNVFLIPLATAISLLLPWRKAVLPILICVGILVISYATTPEVGRVDSELSTMFGAILSTILFVFAGPAIFRAEMQYSILETQAESKRAKAANKAKSHFVANMSHEIRTPLNGIIAVAQLLEKTRLEDRQKDYTDVINTSAETLLTLVNDVLDFSKIESGSLTLTVAPASVKDTAKRAINAVRGLAVQKGLDLRLSANDLTDGPVLMDSGRLCQVLINLLGNAVKFTQDGHVTLTITGLADDLIRFEVSDTGPGIEPGMISQIFDRFGQASEGVGLGRGGTGLGLSISQDFVRLMGGELSVESQINKGSNFFFTLSLSPCDDALQDTNDRQSKINRPPVQHDQARSPRQTDQAEGPKHYHVLLAEDNALNRKILHHVFECNPAYVLTSVENGKEALDILEAQSFDMILLDVNMPVMNGDEALKTMRAAQKPYSTLPVIMLTANATEEQRQRSLAAGADDFVTKPIDLELFWETVFTYLPGEKDT